MTRQPDGTASTSPRAIPPDLSIVIPAYNPQERIFSRVLAAVESLCAEGGPTVECVIVDNKSRPALTEMACVRTFLARVAGARVVVEEAQGLTFARLAGIRATSGRAVVMFDDDNLPAPGYLKIAAQCLQDYPFVGVWGPGNVDVELIDPVPAHHQHRVKAQHGMKRHQFIHYGCDRATWHHFYPHGMGQVITRDVAEAYRREVESGQLSATDRQGGSLASAGDNQIVWQAITMGQAAGMHPDMRLLHVIPKSRTTLNYLRRQVFGCATSYRRAMAQSFPVESAKWRSKIPSPARFGMQLSRVVMISAVRNRLRFVTVDVSELLGEWCGHAGAAGSEDHWTFRLARRLGLSPPPSNVPPTC